ncbi:actin-like ATPase domain-containing protein, partial [Phlegmacium glaucopus]
VAFLDIGCSNTSAAVVTYSGKGMRVHNIVAEPDFGGHDIDQALFLHFTASNAKNKITYDSKTTSLLVNRCEDLKKTLSTAQEGEVDLGSFSGSGSHRIRLTQVEFQSIISNWLYRTSKILLVTLSASGFDATTLDAVELVGGSSQIACLKSYIQNILATSTVSVNAGIDLSAAQGAAYACALIRSCRPDRNTILQDPSSTPFDIKW